MKKHFLLLSAFLIAFVSGNSCTNYLITAGAMVDGSNIITYAADSHQLFGELYFHPRAYWPAGSKRAIYDWDTGKYLGEIDQVDHTYQVVGNMNEYQVVIGETTYGGLKDLQEQKDAILDYGSLIYIALERSKTAREAIKIMTELMDKYGYASEGESFSVSDPNEVWIFEVIGKGDYEKGAVWVARRVPDGYICAHANQARITTFDFQKENKWNDPNANTFNSPDVISFARKLGYKGKDKDFSFSDFYAPVDFGGTRWCEIRVWSFFKSVNKEFRQNNEYFEYAKGNIKHDKKFADGRPNPNGFATNRLPLWIKPDHKLTVHEVMNLMRDHLEGTELDMSKDVGAGPWHCPYRPRPLDWEVDGKTYFNERVVATQQTGFSFVAQSRKWLPNPIGGLFWFAVDDAASSVYTPIYCGIEYPPETYAEGNGSMIRWSDDAAFWVFNQVSNLAYTRYDSIHPEIAQLQQKLEDKYIAYTPVIDEAAQKLYNQDKDLGIQFITDYSVNTANALVHHWQEFYHYLFMKYKDWNIMKSKNYQLIDNGNGKEIPPMPNQPGFSKEWYKCIVEKTGDKFKEPEK